MSKRKPKTPPTAHNASTYTNHGCRCAECRTDHTRQVREARTRRAGLEPPVHGSSSTYYNWKCRCVECRAAHTAAARGRRARRSAEAAR